MYWVYILECVDGRYYIGHTDNLAKRVAQHEQGAISSCFNFNRRPVRLVYSQDFPTRESALSAERQIKGWSRAKKAALVRGDWAEISRLSRSQQDS